MLLFKQMNDLVSNIYKEGNQVADSLAIIGCSLSSFTFWLEPPPLIVDSLLRNKHGTPNFRVCT
jgi:hypothetical protein